MSYWVWSLSKMEVGIFRIKIRNKCRDGSFRVWFEKLGVGSS